MNAENWTPADERRLVEMQERKTRVMQARLYPLRKMVYEDMPFVEVSQLSSVVDWLTNNATTLRDLLAPFDSGVRPEKKST